MSQLHSRDNTVFLRFLAIILVINSHMDTLYPMPIFATGGAIGNSLFFMLSAYGLLLSESYRPQSLVEYYTKRIVRIYPVVWTNILFLILPLAGFYYMTSSNMYPYLVQFFSLDDSLGFIGMIFYPPFWFLQALMFFYLIGFFFIKNYTKKKINYAFICLIVLYVVSYIQFEDFSTLVIEQTIAFKLIFYAMVFLFGIYLASENQKIVYSGIQDFVILLLLIALVYIHKFMWMKGISTEFQFLQQLLILPILYYFMKISHSSFILNTIMRQKILSSAITLIGAMTLELYIIHGIIRPLFREYIPSFPENVILYLLFVFLISYIFYKGNTMLVDRIKRSII